MKKVISVALASALSLCLLAGCGGGSENSTSTDSISKAEGSTRWEAVRPVPFIG